MSELTVLEPGLVALNQAAVKQHQIDQERKQMLKAYLKKYNREKEEIENLLKL